MVPTAPGLTRGPRAFHVIAWWHLPLAAADGPRVKPGVVGEVPRGGGEERPGDQASQHALVLQGRDLVCRHADAAQDLRRVLAEGGGRRADGAGGVGEACLGASGQRFESLLVAY